MPDEDRILLLGRPGCHLCDQAREVVSRVAAEHGTGFREQDIDEAGPSVKSDYWDKIPVVFVDGVQVDFWRVNPDRLRSALRATL